MFKLLNKKKNNKGFTLVELVIAIAILAILVGLLAPQYTKYVEKSRKAADAENLEEMVKAVQVYEADTESAALAEGTYTITMYKDTTTATAVTDALKPAMTEYVPDYATKKLKSKKWGDDLVATITVGTDGKISVAYEPKTLSDYIGVAEKK